MHRALRRRKVDRAAGEPRPAQQRQRVLAHQQRADTRRIAEHLVEGQRHEVRPHLAQIERVGRHESCSIQHHAPARGLGLADDLQRMLDAREVRLRGEGKQVGSTVIGGRQVRGQRRAGDAQLGPRQRRIRHGGALGPGELAQAVDRIVVVGRHQQARTLCEGERFANQLQRARGIRREDRRVLVAGIEVLQHRGPRALDAPRHLARTGAGRVRVAEDVVVQHLAVRTHLRRGMQAAAGVVEIDLPLGVEPAVLAGPQRIEKRCPGVVRPGGEESGGGRHRGKSIGQRWHPRNARCHAPRRPPPSPGSASSGARRRGLSEPATCWCRCRGIARSRSRTPAAGSPPPRPGPCR